MLWQQWLGGYLVARIYGRGQEAAREPAEIAPQHADPTLQEAGVAELEVEAVREAAEFVQPLFDPTQEASAKVAEDDYHQRIARRYGLRK